MAKNIHIEFIYLFMDGKWYYFTDNKNLTLLSNVIEIPLDYKTLFYGLLDHAKQLEHPLHLKRFLKENLAVKEPVLIGEMGFAPDESPKRVCSHCLKQDFEEGYVINGGEEHYCSDECLHAHYTQEEYLAMYQDGEGDSYWTQWEE